MGRLLYINIVKNYMYNKLNKQNVLKSEYYSKT